MSGHKKVSKSVGGVGRTCGTHPWDGEGHAEVLPALQSEAPGGGASEGDTVAAAHDFTWETEGRDILQARNHLGDNNDQQTFDF